MPLFSQLIRHRRVWMVVAGAALALAAGRWLITPEQAVQAVAKGGYWFMLVTFGLFVAALWRLGRTAWAGWRPGKADLAAAALVLGCGSVWLAHEKQGFKILADEVLLLGTSMVMHHERDVSYPIRASDAQGPFQLTHSVVDKRPFFFPFVVSLVHDVTGYRPTNPFHVNAVLGFVFLGLAYVLGWKAGGQRWAGVTVVLLFAGLPLLAQQAAGGGFELLNLVMIAAFALLACRYLEAPDDTSLSALCLAAVLLAMTRYESVLFVVPAAAIALCGWVRSGRVILPWTVVITPLLLVPYLWQNRVFVANEGAWELMSKPEAGAPFALHYVPDNLGHALAFFFNTSGYQANSVLFAAAGLIALPFFGLLIVRTLAAGRQAAPAHVALAWCGLGLFAIAVLLMLYFWGQFDHPVIRRLSLPVHLLFALAIAWVGGRLWRDARLWQGASAVALGALLLVSVPMMSKKAYAWDYTPGIEMAWRDDFLRAHPARDYLFIDQDSVYWITQRIPATAIAQARARREGLAYHLRNHSFSAMYVFQRFTVDEKTGALALSPADDIGPEFELEPVAERRIATLHLARISRITAIREGGDVVARAGLAVTVGGEPRTPEQLEKAKAEYLEKWIKQLP